MSLSNIVATAIFGNRRVLGSSEFKEKMCGKFQLNNEQYWLTVKELKETNTISLNKKRAYLLE